MPAAFPNDLRAKAKALAVQIGVRETARQLGIPEATVQTWSAKEGWFTEQKAIQAVKLEVMESKGLQPATTKSVSDVLSDYGKQTKVGFSKGIAKAAKAVGDMEALDVLEVAGKVKDLVASAAKLHGWESTQSQGATINIAFLSGE